MRKAGLLVILLLMHAASAQSGEYSVVVEENGNALVLIALEGPGTVDIPLPLDVTYPEVLNALYVESADGVEVSLPDGEPVTVAYQTSMITAKTGGGWTLDMSFGGYYPVLVSLPKDANVKSTDPAAAFSETPDSMNLVWDSTDSITVEYDFQAAPVTPTTLQTTTTTASTTTTTLPADGDNAILLAGLLFVVVLAAAAAGYAALKRRGPTSGMRKVMRTLSGNEYKVVDTLLKNKCGMRRNDLERSAGISKSSLALALNNLERKNIVEVDRANTTHYVEVTKWFKEL